MAWPAGPALGGEERHRSICDVISWSYHLCQEKERLLFTSNKFAIVGIFFLAISMVGVIVLVTAVLYSGVAVVLAGVLAALLFGGLWAALPLLRRRA